MSQFENRLAWIEPDHYQQGACVEVVEPRADGAGTASFAAAATRWFLHFNLSEDNRLRYLKQQKVADGVLLEFDPSGQPAALHLVELKATVDAKRWDHIKQQFLGALHNAHALLGLLDLPMPAKVICHTCFQKDGLSTAHSPNPVTFKVPTGARATSSVQDWRWPHCRLSDDFPRLEHHRHQRDETGNAAIQLDDESRPLPSPV